MDQLQRRLEALQQRTHPIERQLRWWHTLVCGLIVLAVLTWMLPVVIAGDAKHDVQTLRSWSRKVDDVAKRFRVLEEFNNMAVLDTETQLVWERRPSTTVRLWQNARFICAQKDVGRRGGWRLPSFYELSSLVDPSVTDASIPRLPPDHPFQDVQAALYWSSTAVADEPGFAFSVGFFFLSGSDASIFVTDSNASGGEHFVWCVRGGSPGPDAY